MFILYPSERLEALLGRILWRRQTWNVVWIWPLLESCHWVGQWLCLWCSWHRRWAAQAPHLGAPQMGSWSFEEIPHCACCWRFYGASWDTSGQPETEFWSFNNLQKNWSNTEKQMLETLVLLLRNWTGMMADLISHPRNFSQKNWYK